MTAATSKSQDLDTEEPQDTENGAVYEESINSGVDERNLVRKLDWHLIPLVMLLCTSASVLLALLCCVFSGLLLTVVDTFSFLDRFVV